MLILLTTGKLLKDPQRRTSANGKPYCTLLLSAPSDDEPVLVNCIAFDDTAERLLKFSKDDTITLLGKAKLHSWERDGETKTGLALTVDKVLSPYDLSKRREVLNEPRAKPTQPAMLEPAFTDDLPF